MPFFRLTMTGRTMCMAVALTFMLLFSASAEEPRTFEVRGVVEKLLPEKGELVVRHDAIPGYMAAMTMPFRLRDPRDLVKVQPGDSISFKLRVMASDGWIDSIKVLSAGPPVTILLKPAPGVPNLDPIQPGAPFPDATLTDEQGHALSLADYRGNALAITFIFTRCPFPNFCPRMTDNFAATQALLSSDGGAGPKNWQLLSITIDPERDTPETLRAYAEKHKADPAHWRFATGSLRDITTLALRCGLNFWDENGLIQHNLRTIVVDASGKVRKVLPENRWTPEELAREIQAAAAARP